MAKPILNKAQEQNPTELRDESDVKIEFSKELLTELQNNTFSGRYEEDVIGHIGKVLEILDLAKIAGVDPFQLRMKAFPLSLLKDAKKLVDERGRWKYFHLGRMCDDDEEGHDPLEFIPWRNSKFKDHKKVDETTKRALLYTWIEIGNEEGLLKDKVSSDEEWEEHEYENPPNDSFPKSYLNINNEKDKNHYDENNRDADKSSGMDLNGAHQSVNIINEQPNEEICRVDKFEVIKYTIGGNEEFLAICTCECDSWARTVNGVSSIL
ncbi:hypothetical protein Tco_0775858 [Tanacetum coccineum]